MARIPEGVIERLKAEVSVQRMVEARGVELKRHVPICSVAVRSMRAARPHW